MTTSVKRKREPRTPRHSASPAIAVGEREACERSLRARLRGERATDLVVAGSRLGQIAQLFGLSAFEIDVVAALWTTAYAPAWRAELSANDPVAGQLSVGGIAAAFGHPRRVRLASESPLCLWRIVAEHPYIEGVAAVSLDAHVLAWLDGEHELDRNLVGHVALVAPHFELASWRIDERARQLDAALRAGDRICVRLLGSDVETAQACAAAIAHRVSLATLRVHLPVASGDELHELAVRVQRQAFLDRCAPCWSARDAEHAFPLEASAFPLQFVIGDEAVAVECMRTFDLRLAEPTAAERRTLWTSSGHTRGWPAAELDDLALRFEASPAEILRVVASEPADAREAARRLCERPCSDDTAALALPLACPFRWDDLVVPRPVRERLEDVAFEARERARLWADAEAARLYPQGRGLVVLLAGPPGTGKTMAAQVLAADLGLELLRVDISRILSKWVGETAQHLQKILSAPASRRALLMFDEADALFGKRIEDARQAQDHFINMDLGHLMVALESYTGVVVLASNLKSNLDAAFVRRIRHAIEFPMPDARARAAIWLRAGEALFGTPLPSITADAFERVSRIEASGAQIKQAALSAAFAARRMQRPADATLLGAMLARELAKDGAGLSSRELATTLEAA